MDQCKIIKEMGILNWIKSWFWPECKHNNDCMNNCQCVDRVCKEIPVSNTTMYMEHGKIRHCSADDICSVNHSYPNTYTEEQKEFYRQQFNTYDKKLYVSDIMTKEDAYELSIYTNRTKPTHRAYLGTGIHKDCTKSAPPSQKTHKDFTSRNYISDDSNYIMGNLLLNPFSPLSVWDSGSDDNNNSSSDSGSWDSGSSYDSGGFDSCGGDCGGGD